MPDLFYPCCEVGDKVPYTEEGPLKSSCWNCGNPDFLYVTDMHIGLSNDFRYYSFTYNARMVRPTGEPPPWRI